MSNDERGAYGLFSLACFCVAFIAIGYDAGPFFSVIPVIPGLVFAVLAIARKE